MKMEGLSLSEVISPPKATPIEKCLRLMALAVTALFLLNLVLSPFIILAGETSATRVFRSLFSSAQIVFLAWAMVEIIRWLREIATARRPDDLQETFK